MAEFPRELSAYLSPAGKLLLNGDRTGLPGDITQGDHFFVLSDVIDPLLGQETISLLQSTFSQWLMPIQATISAETISCMTHNFSESLPKTMNVDSVIFRSPDSPASQAAEKIGLMQMLRSSSMTEFAESVTGLALEVGWGTQIIRYRHGHYVGPHNDHHPEFNWARDGYVDIQFMFSNDAVWNQYFIHEQSGLLSKVWDINQNAAISVFRQPFWHQTTPLIGKPGREAEAERWVIGQVFRIRPSNVKGSFSQEQCQDSPSTSSEDLESTAIHILDNDVPFSQSKLWKMQERFYRNPPKDIWCNSIVPNRITNAPVTAKLYADAIEAFLADWGSQASGKLHGDETVHIIELGTGSGLLGFRIIHELIDRGIHNGFRYVMTDISSACIEKLDRHPDLAKFVANGILDFAVFDARCDNEIALYHSGAVLRNGGSKKPLILIANYFLDSVPVDLFRFDHDVLMEGLVHLQVKGAVYDETDPALISKIQASCKFVAAPTPRYEDPSLSALLSDVAVTDKSSVFPFPVCALQSLKKFKEMSHAGMMVLCGDKGWFSPKDISGSNAIPIAIHGSLSIPAHFPSLASWCIKEGGEVFISPTARTLFGIATLLMPRGWSAPKTHMAVRRITEGMGPLEAYQMEEIAMKTPEALDIGSIVGLLNVSRGAPPLVVTLAMKLRELAPTASPDVQRVLAFNLHRSWRNHLLGTEVEDLAFEIGTIFHAMHDWREAVRYYELSLQTAGEHQATRKNIESCNKQLIDELHVVS